MRGERSTVVLGAILAAGLYASPAWADARITLKGVRVTLGCMDALMLLPDGRVVLGPDLLISCTTSEYADDDVLVYRPADGTCLPLETATADDLDPDVHLVDHDTGAAGPLGAVLATTYDGQDAPMAVVDPEEGEWSLLDVGPLCGGGSTANVRPTAVDDEASTDQGTAVTIDVLANDSDGDGGTLSVVAAGAAANGTTTFTAGDVTYTPGTGFAGTDTFTYTISDGQGGTATATVNVTVARLDHTPPVVSAPADIVVAAVDAAGTPASDGAIQAFLGGATAIDDADGVVAATAAAAPAVFPLGPTVVVFQATDAAGNAGEATATVTVEDRTPPVLTPPAGIEVEALAAAGTPASHAAIQVFLAGATATDNVDGTVAATALGPPGVFPLGTTVVTFVAADVAGNAGQATASLTVVDTTPPVLRTPPDRQVIASGTLTTVDLGMAEAEDLFGPVSITNDAPAAFPVGHTVVTWVAVDANGNRATAVQHVRVGYAFVGFLPPLSPGQVYKAGRVIPVKISVVFADGRHVPGLAPTIGVVPLSNGEPAGEPLDVEAVGAASGGHVFVDTGTHYQFNLDTRGIGAGWIRIAADLGDGGPPHAIDVALK